MGQLQDFMNELDRELPTPVETPQEIQEPQEALTVQEQAQLRRATGLTTKPSLAKASKTSSEKRSDALLANLGMDFGAARTTMLREEKEKLQKEYEADVQKFKDEVWSAAGEAATATAVGAVRAPAYGVAGALTSAYNAVGELINAATVDGAAPPTVDRIDFGSKLAALPETERMVAEIVQQFAPVVASAVTPGGLAVKGLSGALTAYATLDPSQKTLADYAKGTAFEKTAIVGPIVQALQKEDDDTFIEGRFKNVAEYIAPDIAVAAAVKGAAKLFSGVKRAADGVSAWKAGKPIVEEVPEVVKTAENIPAGASVETGTVPVVQAADADLPLFEKEWAKVAGTDTEAVYRTADGTIAANANNPDLIENIAKIYDANPEAFTVRGAQTTKEMIAAGKAIADDPVKVAELLAQSAQRPVTAEERAALEILRSKVTEDVVPKLRAAITSGNEVEMIAAKEALDNALKLSTKAQGVSSETGRALGIIRNLGLMAKTGDAEALKLLGDVGRNKLRTAYIAKYGKENIDALLRQFDEIAKIPDAQFTAKFDEVVRRTKYMRLTDAAYSVMVNSYLTSKTLFSVAGSNAAVATAKVLDNYTTASIGWVKRSEDAATFAEANAFASALMRNYREGMSAAATAIKEGRSAAAKLDMAPIGKTTDAIITNGFWDTVAEKGVVLAEKAAYSVPLTAPTRLVMGADTFYRHIVSSAYIESQAVKYGSRLKLTGADLETFVKDFINKPPEEVLSRAEDMAMRVAMNRDMTNTFLGQPQKWIEQDPTGLARFFMPFMNTRANLVATTLEYTPFAPLTDEFKAAFRAGGEARDRAFAKIVNGSAFSMAIGGLVANGTLELKKEDYRQEQSLFEEGHGRLSASLNIGGRSYPIGWVDPVSRAMNLVAAAYPAFTSTSSELEQGILATTLAVGLSTLDESAYGQIGQLTEVIRSAKPGEDLSPKLMNIFVSPVAAVAIPVSGTVKQVSTLWDPNKPSRVLDDSERKVYDYFMLKLQDTVGYGRPPARNILGYAVTEPAGVSALGPFYASKQENTKLYKSLKILADYEEGLRRRGFEPHLKVEMPSPMIDVPAPGSGVTTQVSLNGEEYDKYVVLATSTLLPAPGGQAMTLEQRLTDYMFNEGKHLARLAVASNETLETKEAGYKKVVAEISTIINMYYAQAANTLGSSEELQKKASKIRQKQQELKGTPLEPFGG